MMARAGMSALDIDLTRIHRRTVTSFYSNLVTRPTGRAVRMGVESQLAELKPTHALCLSILDFSQVNVLDYSCADEIVAKLLLRYLPPDRPTEAYFVARGLEDHHREAVEEVLQRHRLMLVAVNRDHTSSLLGACNPFERACWSALAARTCASLEEVSQDTGLPEMVVAPTLTKLLQQRVALSLPDEKICELSTLARDR
ncbi:MAG TPA: hypothetical protein VF167_03165 [Longimicrobiaceae bacterium]